MIQIGRFREHYGKNDPPFRSTSSDIPGKARVLHYLKGQEVIAAAPGIMRDAFTGERIHGEMLLYSDGEYYWGSETVFYFDKYNLQLPEEFVRRAIEAKIPYGKQKTN